MIFLAIPLLLQAILTVAVGTIADKAADIYYDHVVAPKGDHNEPEQTFRN